MSEIKSTKDYFIFKKHESNRPLDPSNLKKIKASLQAKNLMKFKPILVDGQMHVIDGQHRIEAAKILGIEVYYQINEEADTEDILLINATQKKWSREDYLNYLVSTGNQEYLKIKEFCDKHAITLSEYLRMDRQQTSQHSGKIDSFRLGTYKFPEGEKLEFLEKTLVNIAKVYDKLNSYLIKAKTFTKTVMFKRALIDFVNKEEVQIDIFLHKLTYKLEALHGCADSLSYLIMFKDIYNWKNNNPIEI